MLKIVNQIKSNLFDKRLRLKLKLWMYKLILFSLFFISCSLDIPEKDKIIPPKESKNTYDIFLNLGFNVELFLYSTGHKIPLKAKKIIWNFLINQTNNLT